MQQIEQNPTMAELTPLTMAVLPKLLENGQAGCEVIETEDSFTFSHPSEQIHRFGLQVLWKQLKRKAGRCERHMWNHS